MLSINTIAAAIITNLKADASLIAFLTRFGCENEIRELDYQGDTFLYPCVRVDVGTENPNDDGVCHDTVSGLAFRVYCFSERNSSYECSELAKLVYDALNRYQLTGTGFSTTRMVAASLTRPTRTPDRIWQTLIPFTTIISEVQHG